MVITVYKRDVCALTLGVEITDMASMMARKMLIDWRIYVKVLIYQVTNISSDIVIILKKKILELH